MGRPKGSGKIPEQIVEGELAKMPPSPIDKLEELINKEFGPNSIFSPKKSMPVFQVNRISTGNIMLDKDLGGGLADGKIHLITGPFSSGKTFLALKVASQYTKKGKRVAVIDSEFTFDPSWAEACGMDMGLTHVIRKQVQEEVINIVEILVASGEFGLVILDSMAALIPRDIRDDEAEKQHMGKEAKLNNKMFKKILAKQSEMALAEKPVATFIVINQWREKVNVQHGSPLTLPGGKGQYYFCSTWVDFWADETILNAQEKVVGMNFGFNVRKNKTAPPRRTGKVAMFLDVYNGMSKGDWDAIGATIDLGLLTGVLKKNGTWYYGAVLGEKNMQFTNLWKTIYADIKLESAMIEAVQKTMPEIKFSYVPEQRLIAGVNELKVVGEETAGPDAEGKESETGAASG